MRIIFLAPATNTPIGGVKVLYKHAEILQNAGFETYIYHPRKRDFDGFPHRIRQILGIRSEIFKHTKQKFICTWFEHQAKTRPNIRFDALKDVLVIPEIWAHSIGPQALRHNFKYILYVQNGHMIFPDATARQENLGRIYSNALGVISISENTTELIKLGFPDTKEIFRIFPHINPIFRAGEKERLITYMPRKLSSHSALVCKLLRGNLPNLWRLAPIDQKKENEVANLLASSSIFLSFSHQEGFSLPPLEAALSGNLVVGYTGEGAKEYFEKPIFHEVTNGNFVDFVSKTLSAISQLEALSKSGSPWHRTEEVVRHIENLRDAYGIIQEKNTLIKVFKKIIGNLNSRF